MMEMKQEMVGDAIDDAMDNEEDEVESENVMKQVLDEIGIDLNSSLVDAPQNKKQAVVENKEIESGADKELESRLNNLRR
jgi:charged multivesicular body protein 2A